MAYTITPTTEHTGAEVRGLDLTQPVDAETQGLPLARSCLPATVFDNHFVSFKSH